MPDLSLSLYNTFTVAAGTVTRLHNVPNLGAQRVNIMNLGTDAIWVRADADPAAGDPNSGKLLANTADNGVVFSAFLGITAAR